eukprot:3652063-Pleurochrysis_carterae.AAC.1
MVHPIHARPLFGVHFARRRLNTSRRSRAIRRRRLDWVLHRPLSCTRRNLRSEKLRCFIGVCPVAALQLACERALLAGGEHPGEQRLVCEAGRPGRGGAAVQHHVEARHDDRHAPLDGA